MQRDGYAELDLLHQSHSRHAVGGVGSGAVEAHVPAVVGAAPRIRENRHRDKSITESLSEIDATARALVRRLEELRYPGYARDVLGIVDRVDAIRRVIGRAA
jgi:hypothetical protein